jgi:hypothetical protein
MGIVLAMDRYRIAAYLNAVGRGFGINCHGARAIVTVGDVHGFPKTIWLEFAQFMPAPAGCLTRSALESVNPIHGGSSSGYQAYGPVLAVSAS